MRQNEEKKAYDEQAKRLQQTQRIGYKSTLENQVKDAEELKWKQHALMLEHEKKMHLEQFEGLIPGLRSSKIDALMNPQLKTSKDFFYQTGKVQIPPINPGSPTFALSNNIDISSQGLASPKSHGLASPKSHGLGSPTSHGLASPTSQNRSFDSPLKSPTSFAGMSIVHEQRYNPITNPVTNNIQNPYIVKDIQKGGHMQRNYLAVMADKNLLSTKHTNKLVFN